MSQAEASKPRDALATLRIQRTGRRRRPSFWRRMLRLFSILMIVAALVAGGLAGASRQGWFSLADVLASKPEVRVAVVQVEQGRSADALVVATGYLESRRQAKIGAKAPGRIEVIHVEEGSRVTKGQELAVLEHADLTAALAAATATFRRTEAELAENEVRIKQLDSEFGRLKKLLTTRSISEEEFEDAQYAYEMALVRRDMLQASVALVKARADEARQHEENMFVRAPFDGTVISKDAEVGESIMPGGMGEASGRGSVVTIADLEHLEVDTDVKEDYISRVSAGQAAEVAVDAVPDRRYEGRVRKIIPMGDRARATIKVKVQILDVDERLFPEMSATVYFLPAADEAAVTLPDERKVFCSRAALREDDQGEFVFVLDSQGLTQRVAVTSGNVHDDRVEITDGLTGGERVVLDPPVELASGQLVRVLD